MDRLEPWEIRDAVEDGTRAALGLPRADRGSCLKPLGIGCACLAGLGIVVWFAGFAMMLHDLAGRKKETPPPANAVVDNENKITLPLPHGWTGETGYGGSAHMTVGHYRCDQNPSSGCVLAGVDTSHESSTSMGAKSAAEADIPEAAEASYGRIARHTVLKSGPVTVAGKKGHLIRWKIKSDDGQTAYVQSVVFPAPARGFAILRFGFDDDPKAPKVSLMDDIVAGVKPGSG
ncbi:hypothetical protein GCM10023195_84600 [Actinoallomurus liliacearum]|uniref:DUF5642 domain-containing protein n=1 Tax=Actinoallomurus liliacearum TaxID=1080073 RepID=A0ABP8U1C7_9ACTN